MRFDGAVAREAQTPLTQVRMRFESVRDALGARCAREGEHEERHDGRARAKLGRVGHGRSERSRAWAGCGRGHTPCCCLLMTLSLRESSELMMMNDLVDLAASETRSSSTHEDMLPIDAADALASAPPGPPDEARRTPLPAARPTWLLPASCGDRATCPRECRRRASLELLNVKGKQCFSVKHC